MVGPRIAAIILALSASAALAQEPLSVVLSVDVTDQWGAILPSAGVRATNQATGVWYDVAVNAYGHADLKVPPATYTLRVQAPHWTTSEERSLEVTQPIHKSVALKPPPDGLPCSLPCDGFRLYPEISLERQDINSDIAMIPSALFPVSAKPFRRNSWFHRQ